MTKRLCRLMRIEKKEKSYKYNILKAVLDNNKSLMEEEICTLKLTFNNFL